MGQIEYILKNRLERFYNRESMSRMQACIFDVRNFDLRRKRNKEPFYET